MAPQETENPGDGRRNILPAAGHQFAALFAIGYWRSGIGDTGASAIASTLQRRREHLTCAGASSSPGRRRAKPEATSKPRPVPWRPRQRSRSGPRPPGAALRCLAPCTRGVPEMHQGCTRGWRVCIPCARPLCTSCTRRVGEAGKARGTGADRVLSAGRSLSPRGGPLSLRLLQAKGQLREHLIGEWPDGGPGNRLLPEEKRARQEADSLATPAGCTKDEMLPGAQETPSPA